MKITNKSVTIGILIALAVPALAVTTVNCPGGSAPATLAFAGDYQLKANLACTVSITASNVSLKLNGFTIAPPTGDGIDVVNDNGSVRLNHVGISGPGLIIGNGGTGSLGTNVGIWIDATDYSQISQVSIKQPSTGTGIGIRNGIGILAVNNTFLTIGSNVIAGNNAGIYFNICKSCVINGNDTSGNSGTGMSIFFGSANAVSYNTANGNGVGIFIENETGTRVYSNVTNGNGTAGIEVLGSGVQVFNNASSLANGVYDLYDDSSTCNGNLWANNVFQIVVQACIH